MSSLRFLPLVVLSFLPVGKAWALHDLQTRRWPTILPNTTAAPRVSVLRGRVRAFGSSLPIEGASIEVKTAQQEWVDCVQTDSGGFFSMEVPAGRLSIRVVHPRFEIWSGEEDFGRNKVVELLFRLRQPDSNETIVVQADRVRTEVSRQVYSIEELREIPGSFGDPVRALQSLPGVARPNSLEGNLVVRGAEGANTGFYVDDMAVPYLFHLLIGKSVIAPAFVDDVEFFPGGMPSRFGEVLQAAVNVRTDTEPVEGVRGLVDLNVLDLGAAIEVRKREAGWTFRFAARHSWVSLLVGTISSIAVMSQGGSWDDATYLYLSYWDLFVSGEKKTRNLDRWSCQFIASKDGLYIHDPADYLNPRYSQLPFDPMKLIDAGFGRLRVRRQAGGEDHRSDTWIAGGPQRQQNLLGNMLVNKEGPYYGRVQGWSVIGHREDTFVLDPKRSLQVGGQLTVSPLEAQDYIDALKSPLVIPTTQDTQVSAGLFGEWQWRPGDTYVAPGLRASFYHFNESSLAEPEPRLTLRRELGETWALKGSVGRYTQIPPINQYAEGIGNPALTLMRAWQSSIGAEWHGAPWHVDTALYGSVMKDLVVQDTRVDFHSEGGTAWETEVPVFRPVTGLAYGWETLLRLDPIRHWWGWVALTLGRTTRSDAERGPSWPGDYDQPIALTLLAAYDAPREWKLSGRFRLTSGHPFTPYTGAYDPVYDIYGAYPGDLNSDRYPLFHQLDLRVEKTWKKPKRDVRFYIDVYNAYNARNPYAAVYDFDYSELVPMIYIPILPTLGMETTF